MFDNQLATLTEQQFTGKVIIKSESQTWQIYYYQGKPVWAQGGEHQQRAWQRHLKKYLPDVKLDNINLPETSEIECSQYYILTYLANQKLAKQEQIVALIKSKLQEVFFDLFQQQEKQSLNCESEATSVEFLSSLGIKLLLISSNQEQILDEAQQIWQIWAQKGLKALSPNLAPAVKNPAKLQQAVAPVVYQNFVRLLDGKSSLRDLAVSMNKELLQLTSSLVPYIRKGLLELRKILDLPKSETQSLSTTSVAIGAKSSGKAVIVCIDDSPQICQIMQQIITRAGHQFVGVQNALKAIPTLIAQNPDLIFLDIGMPIMNGYEICAQIQKVSKLKDIPVIILTGNDGIVDRVRAKSVGAAFFVAKPVEVDKILNTIDKFLPAKVTL